MKYLKLYEQFRLILESETVDLKSIGFTDEDIQLIEEMKKENKALRMLLNEIPPFITETKIAFMVIDLSTYPKELVDIIINMHTKKPAKVNVDRALNFERIQKQFKDPVRLHT